MPRKASKPSEAVTPSSTKVGPSEPTPSLDEAIRRRAYELHLERGGVHGDPLDDWLRAEQEVRSRNQLVTAGRKSTKKKA